MSITIEESKKVIGEQPVKGMAEAAPAAPGGWFDCLVNLAGPAEDGTVYIHLRERGTGAFDRWYVATPTMKKEMLATALTAISTGKPVSVYLTTTDEYGGLNRMYVRVS